MRLFLALLGLGAGIGLVVPAHADITDDATRFAAIAANSYCPQALSTPNAAS